MSAENDVPLGEESRRYYEQQFGDRIRQVRKGGSPSSGGSNWNGRAGIGIVVGVIVIVLRIVLAVSRTSSSTPSYTYTPSPPPPQFNGDWQKNFNERFGKGDKEDEDKRINQMLQQIMQAQPEGPLPFVNQDVALGDEHDLREDDVPLLQGLCYRIHQERLRPEPTPGKRICQFLDAEARRLIARAAEGKALDADEKDELLEALNGLLPRKDLYDLATFGPFDPVLRGPVPITQYNRLLLEKCYPQQIVSLSERGKLDVGARLRWLNRARADLTAARKQYEPAKR